MFSPQLRAFLEAEGQTQDPIAFWFLRLLPGQKEDTLHVGSEAEQPVRPAPNGKESAYHYTQLDSTNV